MTSDLVARMPLWRVRQAVAPLQGPLLVALAYFLGAQAAFFIGTLSDQIFALFWPPNVVLFCALLIVPQRHWWRYIAAAFPAHVMAELGVGMPGPQLLAGVRHQLHGGAAQCLCGAPFRRRIRPGSAISARRDSTS